MEAYKNLQNLVSSGKVVMKKVRGSNPVLSDGKYQLIRPYVEILVDSKQSDTELYKKLDPYFTIIIRNYETRKIMDNLLSLCSVAIQEYNEKKADNLPNSVLDPYSVKFSRPRGQFGIGITFERLGNNNTIKLAEKQSFYDTKDLRDLQDSKDYPDKTSVLIFVNKITHTNDYIYKILNSVL